MMLFDFELIGAIILFSAVGLSAATSSLSANGDVSIWYLLPAFLLIGFFGFVGYDIRLRSHLMAECPKSNRIIGNDNIATCQIAITVKFNANSKDEKGDLPYSIYPYFLFPSQVK